MLGHSPPLSSRPRGKEALPEVTMSTPTSRPGHAGQIKPVSEDLES